MALRISGIPVVDDSRNLVNVATANISSNVIIDEGTLFVDAVGNRVGVGITTPSSNLHVVGNANITLGINTSTVNATTVNATTLLITSANITTGNFTNLFANSATINGKLNVNNDLNVTGNIYLNGNTTYINVATYLVEDPLIYLAANNNLTDTVDMGFMGGKNTSGTYSHTGLVRDATDAKWKLFDGLPEEGHVNNIVNFANTYLATLVANVEANTLTVINGVSGNVNFDSGTLFVDSVANEVGIGTTNPTSNLHVVGTANLSAPSTTAASLTFGAAAGQIFRNELAEFAFGIHNSSPFPLYIQGRYTGNTARNIVINPLGGSVGIGGSNYLPTSNLHVVGNANITLGINTSTLNATTVNAATIVNATGANLSNAVLKTGDTMTGSLAISGARLSVSNTTDNVVTQSILLIGNRNYGAGDNGGTQLIATGSSGTLGTHDYGAIKFYARGFSGVADGGGAIVSMHVGGSSSNATSNGMFLQVDGALNSPQNIKFYTGTSGTERIRIDANGNVSIGTTSTTRKLDLFNSGTTTTDLIIRNGTVTYSTFVDSGAGYTGTTTNHPLLFFTNNTEKMRILADGNVAIGATSSAYKLYVNDTAVAGAGLYVTGGGQGGPIARFERTVGSTGSFVEFNATSSDPQMRFIRTSTSGFWSIGVDDGGVLKISNDYVGTNDRISISATGNVGIGTSNPTSNLHVEYNDNSFLNGIVLRNQNTGSSAQAKMAFTTDAGTLNIGRNSVSGGGQGFLFLNGSFPLTFSTNSLERVRIDAAGNVAIGTTSPTSNLHVIGTANITSNLVVGGAITENTNGTFYNVATQFDIGTAPNQIPLNQYLGTMAFQDAAGIAVGEMSVSGNTNFDSGTLFVDTINNRIGISTITPTANLHVNGSSILGGITGSGRRIDVDSSGRAVFIYNDNSLANQITLDNLDNNANTDHGSQILWRLATNASSTAINAGRISVAKQQVWSSTGSTQDAYMAFSTISDGNLSERMRITDVGNVGIGITGPTKKLHVLGSAIISDGSTPANNATLLVQDDGVANTVTSGATFRVANDGSGATFAVFEASSGVSNTVITNAGNMGIGTTSPLGRLHVSGGDTILDNNRGLRWRDSSGNANNNFVLQSDNNFVYYNGNNRAIWSATETSSPVAAFGAGTGIRTTWDASGNTIVFTTSATERMRITSTGNVAIGTSTPSYLFSVFGNANTGSTVVQQINNANTESAALAVLQLNSGAGTRYVNLQVNGFSQYYQESQSNITTKYSDFNVQIFRNGSGTERMRVDANGNVSIGTTSTTYKLEVNGSFAATTKSFVINHPTKPGKKLRYGSLEGPENGVYVRGKVTGNVIELPDYWVGLVDEESITVNLTPIGKHQKLFVEYIEGNKVYISNDSMFSSDINCYYTVFAERKDVDKLVVEY